MAKKIASPSFRGSSQANTMERSWNQQGGAPSTSDLGNDARQSGEAVCESSYSHEERALLTDTASGADREILPDKKSQAPNQRRFILALTLAASVGGFLFGSVVFLGSLYGDIALISAVKPLQNESAA